MNSRALAPDNGEKEGQQIISPLYPQRRRLCMEKYCTTQHSIVVVWVKSLPPTIWRPRSFSGSLNLHFAHQTTIHISGRINGHENFTAITLLLTGQSEREAISECSLHVFVCSEITPDYSQSTTYSCPWTLTCYGRMDTKHCPMVGWGASRGIQIIGKVRMQKEDENWFARMTIYWHFSCQSGSCCCCCCVVNVTTIRSG